MSSTSQRMYVARSGAAAGTSVAVALVAATAKTVVAVLGGASDSIALKRVKVSFDSVVVTDVPAKVEIGVITALGTMTSFTPGQLSGQAQASSCTAGYNASVEPTYNRLVEAHYVPVLMGLHEFWFPLGDEPVVGASQGFGLRITSPSAVNCLASLVYAE